MHVSVGLFCGQTAPVAVQPLQSGVVSREQAWYRPPAEGSRQQGCPTPPQEPQLPLEHVPSAPPQACPLATQ
jgi:hypothetical protein